MKKNIPSTGNGLQKRHFLLLIPGTVLLVLTHLRFGIQVLAWFSSVPFILYLRRTNRTGSIMLLAGFVFLGWTLAVMKILTGDMPWYFAFIYALPITLFHLPGYLSWRLFRQNRYWWIIGWRSDYDTPEGFLLSDIPSGKIFTVYSVLGEWTALLPLLISILFIYLGRAYEA